MIESSGQLDRRRQYVFYTALCLGALAFTVVLLPRRVCTSGASTERPARCASSWSPRSSEQRRSGRSVANRVRHPQRARNASGNGLSAVLATALGVAIVVADLVIRYPEDPTCLCLRRCSSTRSSGSSLRSSSTILPLAMLLLALGPLAGRFGKQRVVWLGILLVAILEPTFQVLFDGNALTWGDAYTWIHVFVIAASQLYVFRRFDFASMYSFRLIYYAYWHVVGGVIRLDVLV